MLHKFDIIWLNMEPHAGIEEGSHDSNHNFRPIIVCSNVYYNQIGMIVGMPITSHRNQGPLSKFLIKIKTKRNQIHGYAIPFKLGGYDYRARQAEKVDSLRNGYKHMINRAIHDAMCDEKANLSQK